MPLGNARDFGHDPQPLIPGDPENAWTDGEPQFQGHIRRLEDELNAENLGHDPHGEEAERVGPWDEDVEGDFDNPFAGEGAEIGEYMDEPNQAELAELMNYLAAMQQPYAVSPMDLCALRNEKIISTDEARAYLASKGVIGG